MTLGTIPLGFHPRNQSGRGNNIMAESSTAASAQRDYGFRTDMLNGDVSNLTFNNTATTNNYNTTANNNSAPSTDESAFLRALQVDPGELKTDAEKSVPGRTIDECWNWILTHSTFEKWSESRGTQLLWIHGGPGKGKTVMALGLVDELYNRSRDPHVFHFFCQNMNDKANTAISVLRGLIRGLALKQRHLVMQLLRDKYQSPEDVEKAPLKNLWVDLLDMLKNLQLESSKSVYFVVDALDECRDGEDLRDFLDWVEREKFGSCPYSVKWLFTSRFSDEFDSRIGPGRERLAINLDILKDVRDGVHKFIQQVMNGRTRRKWNKSTQEIVRGFLRKRAESTYIYVAIVWKEIRHLPEPKVLERLKRLKQGGYSDELSRAYNFMMSRLMKKDKGDGNKRRQEILRVVLLAKRPLGLEELAIVADLPEAAATPDDDDDDDDDNDQWYGDDNDHYDDHYYDDDDDADEQDDGHDDEQNDMPVITELIRQCGHFLDLRSGKVHIFHRSAKDYLMTLATTTTATGTATGTGTAAAAATENNDIGQAFWSTPVPLIHDAIVRRCIAAIRSTSEIRKFPDINSVVYRRPPDGEIKRFHDTAYPYVYWISHAIEAGGQFSEDAKATVEDFLREHFLPWVERTAYLRELSHCINPIRRLSKASNLSTGSIVSNETSEPRVLQGQSETSTKAEASLQGLLYDSFRFLLQYKDIVEHDPPQAYFLAMFFSPTRSLARQNFRERVLSSCCVRVIMNESGSAFGEHWGPYLYSINKASYDWGECRESHTGDVPLSASFFGKRPYFSKHLGFSKDGSTIFATSDRGRNILRWYTEDGRVARSFELHEEEIAVSNHGDLVASVSPENENKINVREAETNSLRCCIDIPSTVFTASFSPDGRIIAMAFIEENITHDSADYLIGLWDSISGDLRGEIRLPEMNSVPRLAFSPDGRRLAIGGNYPTSLTLYDTETQSIRLDRRFQLEEGSLLFREKDKLLEERDLHFEGLGYIESVVFSPRGSVLASLHWFKFTSLVHAMSGVSLWKHASDWESETSAQVIHLISKHDCIKAVAISPDDKTIALCFRHSIAVLGLDELFDTNLATGNAILVEGQFKRPGDYSSSVAQSLTFSPSGEFIACASSNGLISIWDGHVLSWPQSDREQQPLPPTRGLMFSPDGRLCGSSVAGGQGEGLELWDTESGSPKLSLAGRSSFVGYRRLPWGFSSDKYTPSISH
ncbi:YVTN repeat-like/Quino protein amine dehydrogenase [Sodiomyces alkalinus F11]|uniref:YVTN repeat-like/Quino protein amine dehydrogenase n=1 Tax=Sodiomyces alkalinus (strain CBS 110278 / VKM F-3762 / F11) TaxID=1314773 RepID=A0A3N2PQJ7_SODAK|nr:YVTN repeat-like/Quino protein amine dehydrogenase [Sodiomyces alkalinus F11]ROT36791.1 YVTN repeat-like/Quino protein amine dehydrogenase [Sodiomyces alkalinus F11]